MARLTPKGAKLCKHCGAGPYQWGKTPMGWRLFTSDGQEHQCNKVPAYVPPAPMWPPLPAPEQPFPDQTFDEVFPMPQPPSPMPQQPSAGGLEAALLNVLLPVLPAAVETAMGGLKAQLAQQVGQLVGDALKAMPSPRVRIDVARKGGEVVEVPAEAHPVTARVLRHLASRRNVLLKGPAGSGKTHGAEAAAEAMGLQPYTLSLGPQTTMSELFGYMDAHGKFVPGFVYKPWTEGGVLILDEIDACNPQVLVALNAMLSNGHYRWKDGTRTAKHDDFCVVAAGNTFGRGADALYVGRQQLDAATLDRFVLLVWDYDEALEAALVDAHAGEHKAAARAWLAELRDYRAKASDLRLRVVLGMRKAIFGAAMLADGDTLEAVRQEVLVNHVSTDDWAKLQAGKAKGRAA